jgi:hypothetical protein
MQEAKL